MDKNFLTYYICPSDAGDIQAYCAGGRLEVHCKIISDEKKKDF